VIQIRQFEWRDYDAVVAVWAAAGRDVVPRAELEAKLTRDPELFLVAETHAGVAETHAGVAETHAGVAETHAGVAAVVMGTFDGRRGWILRLAVHPAHRRQGLATRLVDELEKRFGLLGCPRVNLLVLPDNTAGLRFWQTLGYLPQPDVLCTKPM